jgi:hypothetical protein
MPEPTREQEAKLQYLATLYDRIEVHGSIGPDLLAHALRVKGGITYCIGHFRIDPDGREV